MNMNLFKYFVCVSCMALLLAGCAGKSSNSTTRNSDEKEAAVIVEEDDSPSNSGVYSGNPFECPQFRIEDNILISDNLPIVVDFYADWCAPCKQYAPVFNKVASQFQGQVVFVRINSDDYPEIANRYDVKAIPNTVFITPGGGTLGQEAGYIDEGQLTTFVNQLIATSAGNQLAI